MTLVIIRHLSIQGATSEDRFRQINNLAIEVQNLQRLRGIYREQSAYQQAKDKRRIAR